MLCVGWTAHPTETHMWSIFWNILSPLPGRGHGDHFLTSPAVLELAEDASLNQDLSTGKKDSHTMCIAVPPDLRPTGLKVNISGRCSLWSTVHLCWSILVLPEGDVLNQQEVAWPLHRWPWLPVPPGIEPT